MFSGTEKFVGPLVQGLAARSVSVRFQLFPPFSNSFIGSLEDSRVLEVLTALVTFQTIPQVIIRNLTDILIEQAAASDNDVNALPLGRSLLVHIQQRHPELLQAAFEAALAEPGDRKDTLEQLLISLSVDLPGVVTNPSTAAETDMVVASTSAEAVVRVVAVRQLYEQLTKDDLPLIEKVTELILLKMVRFTHINL